jgi:uncharacterized protein
MNSELRIANSERKRWSARPGSGLSLFAIRYSNFCLAAGFVLVSVVAAFADETPRTGIIDRAGVVDPQTEGQINAWLLELEQKTGAQLKVLTIDTLNGRDAHEYAIETAKRWRLGQMGKDNGALVVISVKDHKWRIEAGEGIEHAIPDAYCDQVASQYFLPNFRRNDYNKGILEGTAVLAQKIAADANVQLNGVPKLGMNRSHDTSENVFGVCSGFSIILLFIFIAVMRNSLARGQGYRTWGGGGWFWKAMLLNSLMNSGRRGGGWSGGSNWGGFGGGSGGGGGFGGGFGGGGGGSFGGGGAGGSW